MSVKKNIVKLLVILIFFKGFSLAATTFTVTTEAQTFTLDGDYFLTGNSAVFGNYSSITVDNATGSSKNITLDGAGYTVWTSTATAGQALQKTGADAVVITITNCTLRNFDPLFVPAGVTVKLGNNVKIFHDYDYTMLNSSTLTVTGAASINMQGNTLTNPAGSGFVDITGASAKLTIKNGTFRSVATKFAGSSTYNGTLKFENTRIIVDNATNVELDYISNSSCANMEIGGRVVVSGKLPTTLSTDCYFDFKSSGTCTVLTDSLLQVERGVSLRYQPFSPVGPGFNTYNSKRKLILTDLSSKLFLDGGNFTTTNTGLALDRGNLIIDGKATFTIATATAAQLDLGSALVVDILPSATIKLNGPVYYLSTSP